VDHRSNPLESKNPSYMLSAKHKHKCSAELEPGVVTLMVSFIICIIYMDIVASIPKKLCLPTYRLRY